MTEKKSKNILKVILAPLTGKADVLKSDINDIL